MNSFQLDLYSKLVFIDTSALVAIYDSKDQWHADALVSLDMLKQQQDRLFISLPTLHETYTRLRNKVSYETAFKVFIELQSLTNATVLDWQPNCESEAREILKTYRAHKISFHDAICAAYCLARQAGRVFTYDKDFAIMGFDTFPGYHNEL